MHSPLAVSHLNTTVQLQMLNLRADTLAEDVHRERIEIKAFLFKWRKLAIDTGSKSL